MDLQGYKRLISGTDLRGVASDMFGKPVTLGKGVAETLSRAFIVWLSQKTGKTKLKIAVGNDSRLTAKEIFDGVLSGAKKSGCNVVYTGLCSTPSMFMLLKNSNLGADASVMITASHLPADRNGLKFFTPEGGLEAQDIAEICEIAAKGQFLCGEGSLEQYSFMDEYAMGLTERVRKACGKQQPLAGMKIIVDAGNGAGGFFTEKVLKPLGADTTGSLYLEPDGNFPHHAPNPEDAQAIAELKAAVLKNNADLGIIFDTDVDRAGAVDVNGNEINRNKLIALISAMLLKNKPGTIVTDSVTSDGLTEFIEKLGGKHLRYKRGYKNVIDKCKQLNAAGEYSPLAIETSGHAAFKDNYFLDDGAYLVTEILICLSGQRAQGKRLSDLISDLKEPKEAVELRLPITRFDFRAYGAEVIEGIKDLVQARDGASNAPENYEGARINFGSDYGDGWALLRLSLHDPILPLNIESNTVGGLKKIAKSVLDMLKNFDGVSLEQLEQFISDN